MFDSRSDRPMFPGTHRAGHAFRHDCVEPGEGDRIAYGTPKARRLATRAATREAIAEGLAEYLDAPDFHHLPGLGEIGWDRCVPEDGYRVGERVDDRTLAYDGRRDVRFEARKPRIAAPLDLDEGYGSDSIPVVGLSSKRRAAKRPFSRLSAPAFDPALVSRSLSPVS